MQREYVSAARRGARMAVTTRGQYIVSMQYVRDFYGVPAKRGGKVLVPFKGQPAVPGVIVAARNGRIKVKVEGRVYPYHPTWCVKYLDSQGGSIDGD